MPELAEQLWRCETCYGTGHNQDEEWVATGSVSGYYIDGPTRRCEDCDGLGTRDDLPCAHCDEKIQPQEKFGIDRSDAPVCLRCLNDPEYAEFLVTAMVAIVAAP